MRRSQQRGARLPRCSQVHRIAENASCGFLAGVFPGAGFFVQPRGGVVCFSQFRDQACVHIQREPQRIVKQPNSDFVSG